MTQSPGRVERQRFGLGELDRELGASPSCACLDRRLVDVGRDRPSKLDPAGVEHVRADRAGGGKDERQWYIPVEKLVRQPSAGMGMGQARHSPHVFRPLFEQLSTGENFIPSL